MFLYTKKFYKEIIFSLFFVSLLFFTHTAFAAELNLSPSSGSYNVGDTINVRVVLSSPAQSANAISGTLDFPRALLTLNSISKSNSIISLWAVEPTYSNANGTANMEGVILNGYQGSNGTILTLSFKAKATGNANLKFTASSILANDGQGTNISTGTGQASFNISKTVEKVTPVVKPAPEPISPPAVTPTIVTVLTPMFTDYSTNARAGDFLVVKGSADPLNDILITSEGIITSANRVIHESKTVQSDNAGVFTYVSDKAINGLYTITAQARNQNGVFSDKSLPITISVVSPIATSNNSVPTNIINSFSIIIPIIGLIILLILLMIWGWHHILHYREQMHKKLMETRAIVSKSFGILDEDVKDEIKIFKKIKALQSLTSEERLFINQFKKDIEAAERAILNEVKE